MTQEEHELSEFERALDKRLGRGFSKMKRKLELENQCEHDWVCSKCGEPRLKTESEKK